jgi:hypothetical protein
MDRKGDLYRLWNDMAGEGLAGPYQSGGTDKGVHAYLGVYEELFAPLRGRPVRLLEVGVGLGRSLLLWERYLPLAAVYGLDLSPPDPGGRPTSRATYLRGDSRAADLAPLAFDVVIDDGSHLPGDQKATHENLWPRVNPGGLYVTEDVYCPAFAASCVAGGFRLYDFTGPDNPLGDDRLLVRRKP